MKKVLWLLVVMLLTTTCLYAANVTFTDGTGIDSTDNGSTLTVSVESGSIGATQITATSVTAGTYNAANITVDGDGRITNAAQGQLTSLSDVSSSTKTAGNLLVANGATFASVALSGSCTLTSAGVATCSGGQFTDGGSVTYLTSTTDDLAVGGATSITGASFAVSTVANKVFIGGSLGVGTTAPSMQLTVEAPAGGDQNIMDILDDDVSASQNTPATLLGRFGTINSTRGGLSIIGQSDADTTGQALRLRSVIGVADPTDTTASTTFQAGKWNGSSQGSVPMAAQETAFQWGDDSNTAKYMTILGGSSTVPGGFVGIGTVSPGSQLEVAGAIKVTGANAALTSAGPVGATSFTASTDIYAVSTPINRALCMNAAHKLSQCTGAVGGSGDCTCP